MRKKLAAISLFFILLLLAGGANAEFYEWVDEDGNVHISNAPIVQEGENSSKIKLLRGNAQSSDATADQASYDWFSCSERTHRARAEASKFLENNEGWETKPVFDSYIRQLINRNELTLLFLAKLPENEVKALGCAFGFQTVKVQTEEDMNNRGKCRILSVEMGEKQLEPARCRK
ncbi:MAG TPA: DUF4124 domain-containing protein [Deltaproteobacteria bacterium]|nr:DUF4124 domain-containing protein [Deltaproteobacteria bacterium]